MEVRRQQRDSLITLTFSLDKREILKSFKQANDSLDSHFKILFLVLWRECSEMKTEVSETSQTLERR